MFIGRLFNLIGGKLGRWLRLRETRDPEAVYEAAITQRLHRYQQLKDAAAGVIYMRTKLARELSEREAELRSVEAQVNAAVDLNDDECALHLISRKRQIVSDHERLREELARLTLEAEAAKKNLLAFDGEIEQLRLEKARMIARLRNAQARARIQEALDRLSQQDDVRALEEVREFIGRTLATAGMEGELEGDLARRMERVRAHQADSAAGAELEELKRRRRPPLAPLEVFRNSAGTVHG